jgi:hypothetical protein
MSFFVQHCCEASDGDGLPPSAPLGDAFVANATDGGLGDTLEKHFIKVECEPSLDMACHEVGHAATAIYVGAKVGLIERVCVDIDYTCLALCDVLFVLVAGNVVNGERYFGTYRLTPFLRRARCGANRCDEFRAISAILRERPSASDHEISKMIGDAEERVREFFEVGYRRGLLRCAAKKLHAEGKMTPERLIEIFG